MSQLITIDIRLFAQAAQLAGETRIRLDFATTQVESELAGVSIQRIANELGRRYPAMAELVNRSRWAVDNEFVPTTDCVLSGQSVAMIPPVSGG